ncbi:TPA: ATP-dependent endonuclease [Streptococcus pyogenes]|uniref:ATP-dependent nuclease n=1 Tax=Streptococcus pyogenes TaxID=1314 RepID=UPI002B3BD4DF|nr:AAA family ATPase [Streptococcus pyogenes]HES1317332.1 AAA family ATPase [Streptococcus pyogenes]HES1330441.1 AAA family ATPase [Streptococcus pyogenes]HES1330886.1 AAA family ATPase [Streptococcus pyogenes]HES1337388.1 AAA family ATPase [Streptococcus pyogenes]
MIKKVRIKNFKCFKDWFELDLNDGINILVGNNEEGKSTILEAIHLALTGFYRGNYINRELSQYLFNREVVEEYLTNINSNSPCALPEIIIEIYFSELDDANLEGSGNDLGLKEEIGFTFKVLFDNSYEDEYKLFMEKGELSSLPIEYYKSEWIGFNRENITTRSIPSKSFLIDNSSYKYKDGSDQYISNMIRGTLDNEDLISISKAFRETKDDFSKNESVKNINEKLSSSKSNLGKKVSLGVNLGSNFNWESSMITEFDSIPYSNAGRGLQCLLKTELALNNINTKKDKIILIEEPENHLSYSNMNNLIDILQENSNKESSQIIISTHSSFVLNKLGLENLILLSNKKSSKITNLSSDTEKYFKAVSGYDTLRVLLCDKAILVEGPSDELIIQRAYKDIYGKLPIFNGIDIISVGTSFLRFLELGDKLDLNLYVVTDNDGDVEALMRKYKDYEYNEKIKIYYDEKTYSGDMDKFNYNTLEPCILRANDLKTLNSIFNTNKTDSDSILKYMEKNKTNCAVSIFESESKIQYPEYINRVIEDVE